jgi:hypothetical protein
MRSSSPLIMGAFVLLGASVAFAAPPGPGQCFNGGTPENACTPSNCAAFTSCAESDTGCVSDGPAHTKCAVAIGKAFGKAVTDLIKCHEKQAGSRFKGMPVSVATSIEGVCEIGPGGKSAREKLQKSIQKVASLCHIAQLSNAEAEMQVLLGHPSPVPSLSLDAMNANAYCDSTGGAQFISDLSCESGTQIGQGCATNADCGANGKCVRDDAGWVPNSKDGLKCADTLGKELAKLVRAAIACHIKMNARFFAGKDFDLEACVEFDPVRHKSAREQFNVVRDKIHATITCPPCLDPLAWDVQAANAIGTVGGGAIIAFPCNLDQ